VRLVATVCVAVAVVMTQGGQAQGAAAPANSSNNGRSCAQAFAKGFNAQTVCRKPFVKKTCKAQVKANCKNIKPKPQKTPPKQAPAAAPSPAKNDLMKQCCSEKGVPQKCMQFCQYEVNNPKEMACDQDCLAAMRVINTCAANGKDNTQCCQKSAGFPSQCLSYCAGNAPAAPQVFQPNTVMNYMPCFDRSGFTIMQCHKSNAPAAKNWPAGGNFDPSGTDRFPAQMVSSVKGYCALNTGKLMGSIDTGGNFNNLVQGFGG